MKHLFIINPAAGKQDQTREYTQTVRTVCTQQGVDFEIAVSTQPGNCAAIARRAAETGEEYRIYACGGDGTLNEVVSGSVGFPNVAVTHFPGGSGNDFVRIFSEPEAFRDLYRLLDAEEQTFDLIRCNDDYALNVCSVGLDARIGTDIAAYKQLPMVYGHGAYLLSTLVNVVKGISEHYTVEVDGRTLDGQMTMICAANGRYYGGGFNPVPDADPQDGLLDVLLVKQVSRMKVAQVVGKYKNGRYKELSDIAEHIRTKSLRICCDREVPVNLDGELRLAKDITISVAEEKIRFFFPRGLTFQGR